MHTITYSLPVLGALQWVFHLIAPQRFRGTLRLPSSWEEMTDEQIIRIAPALFMEYDNPMTPRLEVLKVLMGMPDDLFLKLTPEQVNDLRRETEWIFREPMGRSFHGFDFKGQSYAMPESIGGMVAAEFAAAESQVKALLTPGQMNGQKLNELVATICRPTKTVDQMLSTEWDGDRRVRYNGARTDQQAKDFRCLSINVKMAVLKWFLDGLKAHQRKYKMLWDESDEVPTAAGKALQSFGFYKVLMDLAETQVFGDWEKTNFTPVTTIFTYLVNKKLQSIEEKRIMRERERSVGNG